MSIAVLLPKLGFSMSEGTIVEWLIADGEAAVEGAPLFVMESDKSSTEIEAPASGRLTILVQAGETRGLGETLAMIG